MVSFIIAPSTYITHELWKRNTIILIFISQIMHTAALTGDKDDQELIDLQAQNKTVRKIAAETGFAPTAVHRMIKKALELAYKPSCSVPFHSGVEQEKQTGNE